MIKKILVKALLILTLALASCEKFVNVEPLDSLSGNNFWKNRGDAETFTLEVYRLFREASLLRGPYFIMGELRNAPVLKTNSFPHRWDINYAAIGNVVELAYTERPEAGQNENTFWQRNVHWDDLDDWTPFYRVIQASNVLYENIFRLQENDPTVSPAVVQAYQAEAVFMRCLAYFFLVRLYGDVPYYTAAYHGDPLPRMSQVQVARNCIEELERIKDNLPWTYDEPANRGVRAMRGSALALLMNLSMWAAGFDTSNAIIYYQKVDEYGDELTEQGEIVQGAYELLALDRVHEIYEGRSRESFFEIPNSANYAGFVAANARKMIPFYVLDGFTVQLNQDRQNSELAWMPSYIERLYPEGEPDGRIDQWFDRDNWLSGNGTFRFYKFMNFEFAGSNTAENYGNSILVFRYAESLLLQAEACAELGRDEKAITLLNRVRARGQASLYPGNNYNNDLRASIFWERCKELMGEGYYFFDVVRTRRILDREFVWSPMTFTAFNSGAWTWPIDSKALANNPYMRLNYWNR